MADLVAGFGSSHSPMLAASVQDWLDGAFISRDRARAFIDLDGSPCRYDDLLARAPADAIERIAPALLTQRHAETKAAIACLRDDLVSARIDALIVIGDDQQELFDASNMPAIGIFHGKTIRNAPAEPEYPCDPALAHHLIAALQDDGFDLSVMGRLAEDRSEGHAFSYVHRFCMDQVPVPIVPLFLNAYYPPNQPSPARCYALGEALARAVSLYPCEARIGVMASGGLSHFVVDEAFDRSLIEALQRKDAAFFRSLPVGKLQSGSSEIRNWICLAGAVTALDLTWVTYVPGYRTPALTGTGLCFAGFR
jgi:3-O-methylgallate 3,4-dioxygenase